MNFSVSLAYDIFFAAIMIFVAIRGKNRGLLSAVFGLVGTVAGMVGAAWVTQQWAHRIYDDFIGVQIGNRVESAIASALETNGGDITSALQGLDFLPQSVLIQITDTVQQIGEGADIEIVPQIVAALQPVVLPLIQVVLFIVVSVVIRWMFQLVASLLQGVNGVPLLGAVNQSLGFAFGFVSGVINCWLICIVLWMAAAVTSGSLPYLNTETLDGSYVYSFFAHFNSMLIH